MDAGQAYILTRLDAIERAIGDMRREMLAAASKTSSSGGKPGLRLLSRMRNTSPFVQNVMAGGAVWTFGLSVKAFLDHGGSPLELIETLIKLLV
jgi:hypothetical protein